MRGRRLHQRLALSREGGVRKKAITGEVEEK